MTFYVEMCITTNAQNQLTKLHNILKTKNNLEEKIRNVIKITQISKATIIQILCLQTHK